MKGNGRQTDKLPLAGTDLSAKKRPLAIAAGAAVLASMSIPTLAKDVDLGNLGMGGLRMGGSIADAHSGNSISPWPTKPADLSSYPLNNNNLSVNKTDP